MSLTNKTNRIAIIGSGAFACAIYSTLKDIERNDIAIYFKDIDCLKYVIDNKKHPKMECIFNDNTLLTENFVEALFERNIVFLCCAFSSASSVVEEIQHTCGENAKLKIVICCKGILNEKPFFLYDKIKQQLPQSTVFVLSGGSFADEMCKKSNTFVNLSCDKERDFLNISNIFSNFLKLKYCNNPQATELLGAVKNVMAIYTGYCGLNGFVNETIKGLVESIDDLKYVFIQLGYSVELLFEPAGIGDIMLTCLSGKSRNKTFGELLALDRKKAIEYKEGTTVEGYNAVFAIKNFCLTKNIRFPMLDKIINLIQIR